MCPPRSDWITAPSLGLPTARWYLVSALCRSGCIGTRLPLPYLAMCLLTDNWSATRPSVRRTIAHVSPAISQARKPALKLSRTIVVSRRSWRRPVACVISRRTSAGSSTLAGCLFIISSCVAVSCKRLDRKRGLHSYNSREMLFWQINLIYQMVESELSAVVEHVRACLNSAFQIVTQAIINDRRVASAGASPVSKLS